MLADGKTIIGFGERKAPMPFVNSCSRFLFLDDDQSEEIPLPTATKSLNKNTKLISLLRQAIEAVEDDDWWAMLEPIGTHISNYASFDQRNYGFNKLSDLFASIDLFEMKKTHGSVIWIKDKKGIKR